MYTLYTVTLRSSTECVDVIGRLPDRPSYSSTKWLRLHITNAEQINYFKIEPPLIHLSQDVQFIIVLLCLRALR